MLPALSAAARGDRAAFVAHGLCKNHGSGETAEHALRDLSLDILEGELVVLLTRPAWGAPGRDRRGPAHGAHVVVFPPSALAEGARIRPVK